LPEHQEIGAFVLERTNMPPSAQAVQEAVRRPVFDIVTLTHWVYSGLVRAAFQLPAIGRPRNGRR
jgi:hypothetical protein